MADHDQTGTERNEHSVTAGKDKICYVKADSSGTSNNTEHNDKSNAQDQTESIDTPGALKDAVKQEKQGVASEKHENGTSEKTTDKADKPESSAANKTDKPASSAASETDKASKVGNTDEVGKSEHSATNEDKASKTDKTDKADTAVNPDSSADSKADNKKPNHDGAHNNNDNDKSATQSNKGDADKDKPDSGQADADKPAAATTTQPESTTPTSTSTQEQNETSADKTEPATQSTHEQSASADKDSSNDPNSAKNKKETIEHKVKQTKEELEQRVKQAREELEQKMKKSFKFFGVEFAPVLLPIERRLQTLIVLLSFSFTTACPLLLILFMIILLFSPLFFLPVLYGTWMFLDRKTPHRGGRRSQFMRRLPIWRYFRDYFPISMTKTADLDASRNYLIGYHPHGILAFGAMMNFGSESTGFSKAYPGITPYILTLNTQFRWPIVRAYLMSFGVCAVSRESIKYILTSGKGHAAVIVVGGAEEALEARPGSFTVVLRKRKGFVRQAIQYGADLVPSYSFGENDLFKQLDNTPGSKVRAFQEWFKRTMSFSPPIIYGRGVFNYSFGLMPYRRPIDTVIGKPIRVERDENPSEELVDHYHQLYMNSLYELFEEHKARHGIADDIHINFI